MKIILTEKISKLGNIGDTVDVATGYARNYLLPNGKAMRWSKGNIALFEQKKAELQARHDAAKSKAEREVKAVEDAKFHMIRSAGDTGHLYGSVSSRDIARMLKELTGVAVESSQVMLGSPIKTIGAFDTKIALHADVIVPVKIYVAQTQDEIDALVAGKILTFGTKKVDPSADAAEASEAAPEPNAEEKIEEIAEEQAEEKVEEPVAEEVKEESAE